MDDLSRVIAELMKGAGTPQQTPVPGQSPAPAPGASAPKLPAGLPGLLPGGFPGGFPGDRRMQLLQALRPFLREERRSRVDRLCRLMGAARGVRGTLQSLGGITHV